MSEAWAEQTAMAALGAEESYQDITFRAVVAALEGARDAGAHDALDALEKARQRASKAETLLGVVLDYAVMRKLLPQSLLDDARAVAQFTPEAGQ